MFLLSILSFTACSSDDNDTYREDTDTEELTWNTPENKERYKTVVFFTSPLAEGISHDENMILAGYFLNHTDKPVSGYIVLRFETNDNEAVRYTISFSNVVPYKSIDDLAKNYVTPLPEHYNNIKSGSLRSYFVPK
jgi:hypothetical protein